MNNKYPSNWGKAPTNAYDIVKLPGNYGYGSSKLAAWIKSKQSGSNKPTNPGGNKGGNKPSKPSNGNTDLAYIKSVKEGLKVLKYTN